VRQIPERTGDLMSRNPNTELPQPIDRPYIPPARPDDPVQPGTEPLPLPPDAEPQPAPVGEPGTTVPAGDPPATEPTRLV